jgi:hypothetical protein
MKSSRYLSVLAIASFAIAPMAAYSADPAVDACVNAFIADKFADKHTIARSSGYASPLPLMARNTQSVRLSAYDADTGRTLATTTCTAKNGIATVAPLEE